MSYFCQVNNHEKMTQLIENKPSRRALIATLSHFCVLRRAVPSEMALTHGKQRVTANSNRRWIAKLRSANFVARMAPLELSGGESR
jgi:hypothetical protein